MPAHPQSQSTIQTTARKRRKMPIEEALRWAIRDELPKRREDRPVRGPQCAHDPIWRMGVFGSPIDNWNREPGMPPAMGDPHPDALVIEAQLEAIGETLKLSAVGSAVCPLDLLPYPIQAELRGKADLDVLIATALHATPAWLVTCAIRGSRPDVGDGPECEPVKSDNGKITLWQTVSTEAGKGPDGKPWFVTSEQRTAPTRAGQYAPGTYCKLNWTRGNLEVVEEQLRYAIWHAALVYLVPELQFLTSVEVLPPAAPIAPWLAPVESEIVPLANVRGARRARLEDRIRPGMRHGSRYTLDERRPAARRTVRRQASPVRQIDPASWKAPNERTTG